MSGVISFANRGGSSVLGGRSRSVGHIPGFGLVRRLRMEALEDRRMLSVGTVPPTDADGLYGPAEKGAKAGDGVTKYHAVICGVGDYPGEGNDVPGPVNNATDFREAFLLGGNWSDSNIELLTDGQATKSGIQSAISNMASAADADDVCVFYFSGHGGQARTRVADDVWEPIDLAPVDESGDGEDGMDEFICPYDTGLTLNSYSQWDTDLDTVVLDDDLAQWIDALPTDSWAVFLDTCHSGGMISKGLDVDTDGGILKGIGISDTGIGDGFSKDLTENDTGIVLASSAEGETSADPPSLGNSLFTYFVLRGMQASADVNADGWISAEESYAYAADKTTAYNPDQHPQIEDQFPGELNLVSAPIQGTVWNDTDADGSQDGTEARIPGRTMFVDCNGNQLADTQTHIASYSGAPIPIPDDCLNNHEFAELEIGVAGIAGTIADVNIELSIEHARDVDIAAMLVSPDWEEVFLCASEGGSGANFTGTVFDDEASTPIGSGSAPFSGTFSPTEPLSAMDGQNPNGTWRLIVFDTVSGITGSLLSATLTLEVAEPTTTTDASGNYSFGPFPAGTYDLVQTLPADWVQTAPSTSPYSVTVVADGQPTIADFGSRDATQPLPMTLELDVVQATEGDGIVQGTVFITAPQPADLVVSLSSDDPTEATVQETATIVAGTLSARFDVEIEDDTEIDGTQTATIDATAAGFSDASSTVNILDNDFEVVDVTVNDPLITDADSGTAHFAVTVDFSKAMDTAIDPTLTFAPAVTATLALNQSESGWTDADTYVAKYDVTDANVEVADVTIDVAGAKDAAGNEQLDYTPQAEFGIDTRNPIVDEFTPADDAAGVSVDADLVIHFNEPVQKGTGNIVVRKSNDDSIVETIPVDDVTIVAALATIDPSSDLSAGTDYYVQIDAGAFRDAVGNDYAGIGDTTTWDFSTLAGGSQVLYVDADSTASNPDGLSWSSAYGDLEAALAHASIFNTIGISMHIEQIWIAEGTYRPSAMLEPGDPRSASFSLVDGVTLYGGFAGTETALVERDWAAHETVLSGNRLLADDPFLYPLFNAYTVVYCGSDVEAAVDGVTIEKGYANGESGSSHYERRSGGGVYCAGTLTVTNSILSENYAAFDGGGIWNTGTLTVEDSHLLANSADYDGGAIRNSEKLTVVNSLLVGNSADRGGGISDAGLMTVTNSTLSANVAWEGGGIYESHISFSSLNNTIVWGNVGDAADVSCYIGTTSLDPPGQISGHHCLVGDLWMEYTDVRFNAENGNLVGTVNPRFVRNPSDGGDGWGDDPDTSAIDESANDDYGDLRLQSDSPAVNAGDNDLAVDSLGNPLETDLDGNPRIVDGVVDMGAYERQSLVYYVNDVSTTLDNWCTEPGSDTNDGLSPATPKATVQAVLDAYDLGPGDLVRIDTGEYTLTSNILVGEEDAGSVTGMVTFEASPYGVMMDRGTDTTEGVFAWEVNGPYVTLTTTTSETHEAAQHWMRVEGGECAIRVAASDVVLERLNAQGAGMRSIAVGGETTRGVTIRNCVVRGHRPIVVGLADEVTIENCTVWKTRMSDWALYFWSSEDNVLKNNIVVAEGGHAIHLSVSTLAESDYNLLQTGGTTLVQTNSTSYATLADWQNSGLGFDANSLSEAPLFADSGSLDFHLQGERYDPSSGLPPENSAGWVSDDMNSPCIDAGPDDINLGAYGTTEQETRMVEPHEPADYYVNDASTILDNWCTAPGSDANDGLSPATPKASVQAILDAYDLGPGDVVRIDTGEYTLTSNILVGEEDAGNATGVVTFEASPYGVMMDRGTDTTEGVFAWEVNGPYVTLTTASSETHEAAQYWMQVEGGECAIRVVASDVVLERLNAEGAGMRSIAVGGETTRGVTVRNCMVRGHRPIVVGAADEVTIENCTVWKTGTTDWALYFWSSEDNVLKNNIVVAEGGDAIHLSVSTLDESDYNLLQTGGTTLVWTDTDSYATLADWQNSGFDANSLSEDPLFADSGSLDFHLESGAGHYAVQTALPPEHAGAWIADSAMSPCIGVGLDGVNLGAYGGTEQASRTVVGDLNGDGIVGSGDLDIVRANWSRSVLAGSLAQGDPSADGFVGSADLDIVRGNWGTGISAAASVDSPSIQSPISASSGRPVEAAGRQKATRYAPRSDAAMETWDSARIAWAEALDALMERYQTTREISKRRDAVDLVLAGMVE